MDIKKFLVVGMQPGGVPWYRAGGAPAPIAAYLAKGAASLAASYINLVNPGTYNLSVIVSAPTLDADGWNMTGDTLDTGIVPKITDAFLIRVSGVLDNIEAVMGAYDGSNFFVIRNQSAAVTAYYNGSTSVTNAPAMTAGVYGAIGKTPYRNGVAETAAAAGGSDLATRSIYLGANNNNGTRITVMTAGHIQAYTHWRFPNVPTPTQLAAVSTAMAAL